MALYCGKGFVAYNMLHFAGVVCGSFFIYADVDKKIGKQRVPLINLVCNFKPQIGKSKLAVLIHQNIAAVFEQSDSP